MTDDEKIAFYEGVVHILKHKVKTLDEAIKEYEFRVKYLKDKCGKVDKKNDCNN